MNAQCLNLGANESTRQKREAGFTLLELVVAVAIFATSCLSLIYLKISALQRYGNVAQERHVQRIAQEKLYEVIYGFEQELEGEFEDENDGQWEATVQNLGTFETPLYATTMVVRYEDENQEEHEYSLTSWIFYPPEESALNAVIEAESEF